MLLLLPAFASAASAQEQQKPLEGAATEHSSALEDTHAVKLSLKISALGKRLRDLPEERLEERRTLALRILEIDPDDLQSHHNLAALFQAQGNTERAEYHGNRAKQLRQAIGAEGTGARDSPFLAKSAHEAYAFLAQKGYRSLGSIYILEANGSFILGVTVSSTAKPRHRDLFFDLQHGLSPLVDATDGRDEDGRNWVHLLGVLGRSHDSAAQTAIGLSLYYQGGNRHSGIRWLQGALHDDNLKARLILGRIYQLQAYEVDDWRQKFYLDQAEEHFLHAIGMGSDSAMYSLASLQLANAWGRAGSRFAPVLLARAHSLGNVEATQLLAGLYNRGQVLEQDLVVAAALLRRAAASGDRDARIAYIRFQIDRLDSSDKQAYRWLRKLAKRGDAEAMMHLGRMHARGLQARHSYKAARSWWRRAGRNAEDPEIINWVAYTLAAAVEPGIRDPSLALRLMEDLMAKSESSRNNYAHLDTWATAHAAAGNFKRAIEIQLQALRLVKQGTDLASTAILEDHLAAFQREEVLYDVDSP